MCVTCGAGVISALAHHLPCAVRVHPLRSSGVQPCERPDAWPWCSRQAVRLAAGLWPVRPQGWCGTCVRNFALLRQSCELSPDRPAPPCAALTCSPAVGTTKAALQRRSNRAHEKQRNRRCEGTGGAVGESKAGLGSRGRASRPSTTSATCSASAIASTQSGELNVRLARSRASRSLARPGAAAAPAARARGRRVAKPHSSSPGWMWIPASSGVTPCKQRQGAHSMVA